MYQRLLNDFKSSCPGFPSSPSPDIGLAVKHIRLRMGLTQNELAQTAKMKPAALKTLENGYSRFTKTSNLLALARALRIDLKEIILEAGEWFPGNFFVLKLSDPQVESRRKRKLREETWFKRRPLPYEGFDVDFCSPPVSAPSHFCFSWIQVAPGKAIRGLKMEYPNKVAGFVQRGTLKLVYDSEKEIDLFGNQGFTLRGDRSHDLVNVDRDNPVRLCLAFSLAPSRILKEDSKVAAAKSSLSAGRALNRIRYLYSDSDIRPLTFTELSSLTGIDAKALQYLENTMKEDDVIYWDKIEKITRSLGMPLSRFLELAEGKDSGYCRVATALDRALIDYRHYLGVRIKSTLFPGTDNDFHISETYIEPKGGIRRVSWKRRDNAMIAAYVEDGELLVEVGKNRKTLLAQGESVYFDGGLGYIFTNPGTKPSKLMVATHPAITF